MPSFRSLMRAAKSDTLHLSGNDRNKLGTRRRLRRERRCGVGSYRKLLNPLTHSAGRHQQCTANVTGLPFHPIIFRRIHDRLPSACPRRFRRMSIGCSAIASPQWCVKINVTKLVRESRSQPMIATRSVETLGNSHLRPPIGEKIRQTFDAIRQLRVEIEIVGLLLDKPRQFVSGNGQSEAAGPPLHKISDDPFAPGIQHFCLEVQTLNRPPKRIAKWFHFFLLPVLEPFSALRKAWYAISTCSLSTSRLMSAGRRFAWK